MSKVQLLLRAEHSVPSREFGDRVMQGVIPRVLELNPQRLKVTVTDLDPPRFSVIPFSRRRIALLSVWPGSHADNAATCAEGVVTDHGYDLWCYVVDESIPLAYERDWPDGQATPGVSLLTVFNRKPGLSDEVFLDRWHNGHTPLSLRLHPLWNYIRNVVLQAATEGTPHRDAIVEEHFRRREDLLNPAIFFGSPATMLFNMLRVGLDVRRFIHLSTIETYLAREYHIRS